MLTIVTILVWGKIASKLCDDIVNPQFPHIPQLNS